MVLHEEVLHAARTAALQIRRLIRENRPLGTVPCLSQQRNQIRTADT
jgi:hypothetical protein